MSSNKKGNWVHKDGAWIWTNDVNGPYSLEKPNPKPNRLNKLKSVTELLGYDK